MIKKSKPKTHSKEKLHNKFLVDKAKKLNKEWLDRGGSGKRKYFGYFTKSSMSAILLAILFFVMLGDVILIHNYFYGPRFL